MSAVILGDGLQLGAASPEGRRGVFLSTEPAGRREIAFALAAVLASAALFVAVAPFAKRQFAPVAAFIPAYESALVICDLITAVLLFGQVAFLRSRALLVLGSGYLFTAFIAFAHALTFPGVFSTAGLLGGGSQTTAWMYMFWHAIFPLFVLVYALLKGGRREATTTASAGKAIAAGIAAALVLACGFTVLATVADRFVSALIVGGRFTPWMTAVVSAVWMMSVLALIALWRCRPHTVLDLWLMVVMCAWLFDIALSAVLNAARYDLGWYAGRMYGLLAASSLLIVLLNENVAHYARLLQLSSELRSANRALEKISLIDSLTDIANRRFFDRYLGDQMAVAQRHKRPLSLILYDIDAFKAYNDHYGHQAGDACLKQVAAAIKSCCRRPADLAARYGGEEFAMILPDTELAGAAQIAEAARHAVAELRIPHATSPSSPFVSVSGGVSVLRRKTGTTAQQLITAADQTLYQAKRQGRNRMVAVQSETRDGGDREDPGAMSA